jgi:hypothetical protein
MVTMRHYHVAGGEAGGHRWQKHEMKGRNNSQSFPHFWACGILSGQVKMVTTLFVHAEHREDSA